MPRYTMNSKKTDGLIRIKQMRNIRPIVFPLTYCLGVSFCYLGRAMMWTGVRFRRAGHQGILHATGYYHMKKRTVK